MISQAPNYHGYRFPPEIISHAVWLYHRFCHGHCHPAPNSDPRSPLSFAGRAWRDRQNFPQ